MPLADCFLLLAVGAIPLLVLELEGGAEQKTRVASDAQEKGRAGEKVVQRFQR